MDALRIYESIQYCIQSKTPYVLVTLIHVRGSAPQDVGAKMVVTESGLLCGTVGGGKIEATAIHHAQQMMANNTEHELCIWNLQKDIGMSCGGEVQLFFDGYLVSPWNICIFGAGHVAQELVPILCKLDAQVTCIDPRSEWLDRLPTALNLRTFCLEDPELSIQKVPNQAYVGMMTQGHSTDVPLLIELHRSGRHCSYVGMIGSTVKARRVHTELRKAGVSEDWIQAIHSPIGLSIGSNHPVEIAISIAAELIQSRDLDGESVHP